MHTFSIRNFLSAVALAVVTACGSSDSSSPTTPGGNTGGNNNPSAPTPVSGVTATTVSSSSIRVQFTSRAGDNSYTLERAEGANGSFAQIQSMSAPGAISVLIVND